MADAVILGDGFILAYSPPEGRGVVKADEDGEDIPFTAADARFEPVVGSRVTVKYPDGELRVDDPDVWDVAQGRARLAEILAQAKRHGETHALGGQLARLRRDILKLNRREADGGICDAVEAALRAWFPGPPIGTEHPLVRAYTREIAAAGALRPAWEAFLAHAYAATSAAPTKKWLATMRGLVDALGAATVCGALARWLPLVRHPKDIPWIRRGSLDEHAALVCKGMIWTASLLDGAAMAPVLGDLGAVCYTKIPNVGPVAMSCGNACLWALSAYDSRTGVAHISRLKARVRYTQALRLIDKALGRVATQENVAVEDVEEIGVPSYDLDAAGRIVRAFGKHQAVIAVEGSQVAVRWLGGPKPAAAPPPEVKLAHAPALRELTKQVKTLRTALAVQKARLEGLWLADRALPYPAWRERYLDHPLVGHVARRLIWTFGDGVSGIHRDGKLVDAAGKSLRVAAGAVVRLWHPAERPAAEVGAWRAAIVQAGITQPFKQAHRETYVLTAAEERTATYSNRFAAHWLRQGPLIPLCKQRGWRVGLFVRNVDTGEAPNKRLAAFGQLVVGFQTTPSESDPAPYPILASGQVSFESPTGCVPLAEVAPVAFSELMRDVDLFVAVASIGIDPDWRDLGPTGAAYWHRFAAGDIGEQGKMRHEVLQALLPALAIKAQCTLTAKHLVVQGKLAAYNIHLGSGHSFIEGTSRYLCIVPANASGAAKVALPFEDDAVLSLILSKAFLLAKDDKIQDQLIIHQIKEAKPEPGP